MSGALLRGQRVGLGRSRDTTSCRGRAGAPHVSGLEELMSISLLKPSPKKRNVRVQPAARAGSARRVEGQRDLVSGPRDHEEVVGSRTQLPHVPGPRVAAGQELPGRRLRDARVVVAEGLRPSGATSAEKPRSPEVRARRGSRRRGSSGTRPGARARCGPSRCACWSRGGGGGSGRGARRTGRGRSSGVGPPGCPTSSSAVRQRPSSSSTSSDGRLERPARAGPPPGCRSRTRSRSRP